MHDLNARNAVPLMARPLRLVPLGARRRVLHRLLIGQWPDMAQPRHYSEVATRELHHESGVLAEVAGDKDLCKTYVRGLAAGVEVPRTRWIGTDVSTIPASALEGRWVAKFNAGSGMTVRGEGPGDHDELIRISKGWSKDVSAEMYGVTYYKHARHAVLIEDHIDGLAGRPLELRFFCFAGRTELVQMFHFTGDERSELYLDRNGARVDVSRILNRVTHTPAGDIRAVPAMYLQAREAAERLAGAFPHVRVDVYVAEGKVWFGELTPYPHGGMVRFAPDSFDRHLAQRWLDAIGSRR